MRLAKLPGPQDDILLASQVLQRDRTSRMDTRGADADRPAEAELPPVVQSRRGVHEDRAGVHLPHEPHRRRVIASDDRISMARPVLGDMLQGLVHVLDDPDGECRSLELPAPVLFLGFDDRFVAGQFLGSRQRDGLGTAMDLHLELFQQPANEPRYQAPCRCLVHQQGISGIGGRRKLHLGVHHDVLSQRQVGIRIDIDVTDPHVMAQHREARLLDHCFSQPNAAPRNDRVHIFIVPQQFQYSLALGPFHEHHRPGGHTGLLRSLPQTPGDHRRRVKRFGSPPDHTDVTRFQAERHRLRGHRWAGIGDDPDHPDRHPHPADFHPVRAFP